jgi:hypothetical protein
MEKNTLIESTELVCKVLLPKKWGGSVGVATTSTGLEDLERDTELEQYENIYLTGSSQGMSLGLEVAGLLVGEKSYVMELSEWVGYYWPFVSHRGLVCLIPETIKNKIHEDYSVYPAKDITRTHLGAEPGQLIAFSTASPYETPLSEDLFSFCFRQNIFGSLQVSVGLIRTCFPSVREVMLQPERDPDTGEEWLVLDFGIVGEIEEILNRYDKYTDLWVKSVPWPEREKIRLSYNIV